jgi:hypothetical protein
MNITQLMRFNRRRIIVFFRLQVETGEKEYNITSATTQRMGTLSQPPLYFASDTTINQIEPICHHTLDKSTKPRFADNAHTHLDLYWHRSQTSLNLTLDSDYSHATIHRIRTPPYTIVTH